MKYSVVCFCVLLLSGCLWKVPLSKPQGIPIDQDLVGQWKMTDEEGDTEHLSIVKWSETEQLLILHDDDDPLKDAYYRMYPITVRGVSCLQVQLLQEHGFTVVSYAQTDSGYTFHWLNEDYIGDSITSTREMKKQFKKNIHKKDLFTPSKQFYKKISE